jgi:hypothetical protein
MLLPQGCRTGDLTGENAEHPDDLAHREGGVDDDCGDVIGELALTELDSLGSGENGLGILRFDRHEGYTASWE